MLAELFLLFLEHLRRTQDYPDGAPRVVSTSAHVPKQVPAPPLAPSDYATSAEPQ